MLKNEKPRLTGLLPALKQINDQVLKEKVMNVWINAWKAGNFKNIDSPSQWEVRRNEVRLSNIDHTNQVTACAIAMAEVIERTQKVKINHDYLIAGALLHDIDKFILFDAKTRKTSKIGKQFYHTFLSGHLALSEGIPPEIAHIVVTHSAFFSAVEPQSIEALILRQADHLMALSWNMKRKIKVNYKAELNK